MRKTSLAVILGAALLPACGGGTTTPPPVTTPPTTQPPNFSGTYSGIMLFNVAGQAEIRPPSRVTVTHNGSTLTYSSSLTLTINGQAVSFPLGSASQSGDTFVGNNIYQSQGCGSTTARSVSRFAGNLMNLQVFITPTSCAESRAVGELSR